MDVKRKNGEYIGAFVPYGYEKSDDDKHKLVIDIYAAGIVKEIFRLKLHGMSQDAIATQLNNEGVLAPIEVLKSDACEYGKSCSFPYWIGLGDLSRFLNK